jgi:outer membrane lipoprotein SlyB
MKTLHRLAQTLLLLLVLLPLAWLPAQAQNNPPNGAWAARIDGFDVQPVNQPSPGQELMFTLYGSPGAQVSVQISGAGSLALDEVEAGVYEGHYTIRQRDRIDAASTSTANLRLGNRVATALLNESLVAGRPSPVQVAGNAVARIEHFDLEPAVNLAPGANMGFRLRGTPGARATVRIAGVPGNTVLDEVRPGVYEGNYTIRYRDRIAPNSEVTANLRVGNQDTSRVLGQSLLAAQGRPPEIRRTEQVCLNCGVIESIHPVEVRGEGGIVGKVAGGLVGALLGSQIGAGRGKTAAEIAGAVGGVAVGNEIDKRNNPGSTHFEVLVRLDGGGTQTVAYAADPQMRVGTRVRVDNGVIKAL